jgi:hypothetical protein
MKKAVILFLLMGISSAQAALFQGNSSGVFLNPVGPSTMVTTGVGTDTFTWGRTVQPSSLGYTGTSFNVNDNDAFVFGSLDYFNGSIPADTGADSVDLSVMLSFSSPLAMIENFVFDLALINTLNTSDPNASADIVNFDNTVSSNFFSADGIDYTLEFLGFGTLSGSGFTVEDSFRVLEGGSANVNLVGRITSTPGAAVPEPATLLLFGLGFLGLIGASRKS